MTGEAPTTREQALQVARRAWPRHAECKLETKRSPSGDSWDIEDKTHDRVFVLHDEYIRVALEAR